ncbi:MAG: hypothetical protein ND895_22780 [Pyrinomonadaceae bacterium]|nr:hypothetical protein [Pyrinomonadaceae bacterium]
MRNYRSLPAKMGGMFPLALALICISTTSLRAQRPLPGTMSERDRNLLDRETQITLMERGARAAKGNSKREPQLLLNQINEDFARLQVVNNEMKQKNSADVVLDFKYVSDAAAEIKKRSSRLRTNLVFPESAKTDKREKSPPTEGLKSQLVKLDRLIGNFVTNPVFTDPNVINAELAAKARGDLDEIIELSDTVKKHAANLNKTNPKSR